MAREEREPLTLEQQQKVARWLTDFPSYAAEVLQIQTKDAARAPFVLNRAQREVWRQAKEDLQAGRPVRMYILKGRQMGMSTLIQGILYWSASLRPNRVHMVTAHEDEAAVSLFSKSEFFYMSSPAWLQPMLRRSNRKELYFANSDPTGELGLESKITVQTANNKNLGASRTLQGLHLSEFAKYEGVIANVKRAIAIVLQAVPELPWTFVFLETTADGMGYAHKFWKRKNAYRKIFISWIADETYTLRRPLTAQELTSDSHGKWGDEVWYRDRVLEELALWYPENRDNRAWLNHEALCRLAWRRWMLENKFEMDLDLFRQEYPITAEEAFVSSGTGVFPQQKLATIEEALTEKDVDGYAAERYQPARYRLHSEEKRFYLAANGPLRLYEAPQPGVSYVIGADVGEGIGQDKSAAQVLRLPEMLQVAVYQDTVDPDDFADVLYALGKAFGFPALCPEANGPGSATTLKLGKGLRYPHLYQREVLDHQAKKYVQRWGWHTNAATKPIMISDLRAAVRNDTLVFRDLPTLKELKVYIQHPDGKLGAMNGEHDDLVMALALALQMAQQFGGMALPVPPAPEVVPYSGEWWGNLADEATVSSEDVGSWVPTAL